ncbi:MAG: tetratricopeptide repeat protein [Thermodesulfobacteriota bacterium]
MTGENLFSKRKLETINIEKRDWMEELNLPPQLAKFLRKNGKEVQIAIAVFVVAILAWNAMQYYRDSQREKTTAALAQAMQVTDDEGRIAALRQVTEKSSGSDAALWARVELGHLAFKKEDYAGAVEAYKSALDGFGATSSVAPFIEFALAGAYEKSQQYDGALEQYRKLAATKGFERQGNLGLARVYEQQGDKGKAAEAYRQVLAAAGDNPAADDEWIEEKANRLAPVAVQPAAAADGQAPADQTQQKEQ